MVNDKLLILLMATSTVRIVGNSGRFLSSG